MAAAAEDGRLKFDRLLGRLESLCREVSHAVSAVRVATGDEELRSLERDTRSKIREGETTIQELEAIARGFSPRERRELGGRVKRHEADLKQLERDFRKEMDQTARGQLLSGGMSREERQRREKMAGTDEKLQRGTRRLEESRKLMDESVGMGIATVDELDTQEESLLRARSNVQSTRATTRVARGHIMDIIARAWKNKIVLGIVIVLLFAIDVFLVWFKFIRS